MYYAVADLAGFVRHGGALDAEVRRRGQTLYLPDGKIPLHPAVLSEGAASLLPDQISAESRRKILWDDAIDLYRFPESYLPQEFLEAARVPVA